MALVGIVQNGGPYLALVILLDAQDTLIVVVACLGAGGVEFTALHDDQDAVVATKQSQRLSMVLIVDAQDVRIEPHFAVAQGGLACLLERDAVYLVLGDDVASCLFALDGQFCQIDVKLQDLEPELGFEGDAEHLGLAIGIGCEPGDFAARFTLCDVVFAITRDTRDSKSFHEGRAASPVLVQDIIDCACITFLEDIQVKDVFSHINLVGDFGDLELTVFIENDDVINVRAVAHEFVLFKARANEAVGAVDV